FKKPFEEVILADYLLTIEHARQTVANELFRVFPVSKKQLVEEGSEFASLEEKELLQGVYVGDKWGGKYLRAPDIFTSLLKEKKEDLYQLNDLYEGEVIVSVSGYVHDNYLGDEHPKKLVIKSIKETRKIALKESSVYEMGVKQTP